MGGNVSTSISTQTISTIMNNSIKQSCPNVTVDESIDIGVLDLTGSKGCTVSLQNTAGITASCMLTATSNVMVDQIMQNQASAVSGGLLDVTTADQNQNVTTKVNSYLEQRCGNISESAHINIGAIKANGAIDCHLDLINQLDVTSQCYLNAAADAADTMDAEASATAVSEISNQAVIMAAILVAGVIGFFWETEHEGEKIMTSPWFWMGVFGIILLLGLGYWVYSMQSPPVLCQQDEKVVSHICTPCEDDTTRDAGDSPLGNDTTCTPTDDANGNGGDSDWEDTMNTMFDSPSADCLDCLDPCKDICDDMDDDCITCMQKCQSTDDPANGLCVPTNSGDESYYFYF
jgi:hypothetical protein